MHLFSVSPVPELRQCKCIPLVLLNSLVLHPFISNYITVQDKDLVKINIADTNCTELSIAAYPVVFTAKPPRYDMTVICIFLCLNFFVGLSIVCDHYCIPAIERICFS